MAEVDGTCGMQLVSLVDYPAVEKDFLAFDGQPMTLRYAVKDEEKRLIFGVLMRANFPIYREDAEIGGFWLVYKPETLRVMAEKYLTEGRANAVNLMHEGEKVEGVNMVQFFIKDKERGIVPAGFDDVEDGSLFGEFHVTNDDIWEGVKAGTFKGFSIETVNYIKPATTVVSEEKISRDLLEQLGQFLNKKNMSDKFKNALAAFMEAVGAKDETPAVQKFGSVTTDKGILHWDGDEDLKAGDDVFVEDENGERRPAESNDYTTDDGKVIRVTDGRVADIVDDRAEVAEEAAEEIPEEEAEAGETERRLAEAEDRIARLEEAVARLLAEATDMHADMEAMKKQPLAAPAHEEFQNNTPAKTGDKRFDRLREIGNALTR